MFNPALNEIYNPVPSPECIPEDASQHFRFLMQIHPYRDCDLNAVAEEGNQLVGFISYRIVGHIDMLFTTPTYTRHGVTSRLYRHVENELATMGVIELSTEASLVVRSFFERHGFRVIEQQCVELRGEVFLRSRFTLRLPDAASSMVRSNQQ